MIYYIKTKYKRGCFIIFVAAIIFINCACVLYTIGVWSEKTQGNLNKIHLIFFWLGLLCDTVGTTAMNKIAHSSISNCTHTELLFHGITGLLAILLMLFHALWATIVFIKNNIKTKEKFHKFSLLVWVIWLVPFLSGIISHILKIIKVT